jgi:hypothetical protein
MIYILLWMVFVLVFFVGATIFGFTYDLDVYLDQDIQNTRMVIGIGLPQTGTSSLANALMILGFQVQYFPLNLETKQELYQRKRNALVDVSLLKFRPLDMYRLYPGAVFIYTPCDEGWVSSMLQLRDNLERWAFLPQVAGIRQNFDDIFGLTKKSLIQAKEKYENEITELRKKTTVYEFNVTEPQKWEKLCRIVQVLPPQCVFPTTGHVRQHITQVWRCLG